MFSKNERDILKLISKSKQSKISYHEAKESIGIEYDDVKSACSSLISKGYAEEKYYSPMPGSLVPWGIVLSEKGRHRFRYAVETFASFVFRSVLVPIIVAFATTMITIWVTGYFSG